MTTAHGILLSLVPAGYLVGSVPFGYLVGLARGVDVRKAGSGNIGATNVGRLLGRRFFFVVFLLDLLKGLVPMLAAGAVLYASRHGLRRASAPRPSDNSATCCGSPSASPPSSATCSASSSASRAARASPPVAASSWASSPTSRCPSWWRPSSGR